jgi:secondary thiamine-phosphate synthase enzyme
VYASKILAPLCRGSRQRCRGGYGLGTFDRLLWQGPQPVGISMSGLQQAHCVLRVATSGPGFTDVTATVAGWLKSLSAGDGLLTVFVRHTSASLVIQENADPDVLRDLADALERIAPRNLSYRHGQEGADDMPAHIKAMATTTSLAIPVIAGAMVLGTWQAIYLAEHRDGRRQREIVLQYTGELAR